jgi:DNA mismatch repair ATPase MutS
MAACS